MTEQPALCKDHEPVIASLREKDHVDDRDSERAANQISHGCPQCYALNGRSLR